MAGVTTGLLESALRVVSDAAGMVTIGFTTGEHTIIAATSNRPRDLDDEELENSKKESVLSRGPGMEVARGREEHQPLPAIGCSDHSSFGYWDSQSSAHSLSA